MDTIELFVFAAIAADREVYERNDVSHLVTAYLVDMKRPNGFSVMAVDRKHALISFPPAVQVESLEKAMKFENQSQLVGDLVDWFDNQLLVHSSLRIDEWMKQNQVSFGQRPPPE